MFINLNSVGCCIDSNTHLVYPLSNVLEPCLDNKGQHIMECIDEWMNGLSEEDFIRILSFVYSDEEV